MQCKLSYLRPAGIAHRSLANGPQAYSNVKKFVCRSTSIGTLLRGSLSTTSGPVPLRDVSATQFQLSGAGLVIRARRTVIPLARRAGAESDRCFAGRRLTVVRRWSARWPRNRRRNRETTKASGAISAARNSRRTRSARSRPRAACGARRPRCRPPPRSRPCRGRHAAARIGLAEKRIHPLQHALRKRGPNIADAWDLTWVTALSINLWDLQSQERKKKHQPLQSRHSAGWRRTDKRRRRSTPMRKASRRDLDRRTHLLKSASNSNLP